MAFAEIGAWTGCPHVQNYIFPEKKIAMTENNDVIFCYFCYSCTISPIKDMGCSR